MVAETEASGFASSDSRKNHRSGASPTHPFRTVSPRTLVNKGKSEGLRPLRKNFGPYTLAYRLILNVPRRR